MAVSGSVSSAAASVVPGIDVPVASFNAAGSVTLMLVRRLVDEAVPGVYKWYDFEDRNSIAAPAVPGDFTPTAEFRVAIAEGPDSAGSAATWMTLWGLTRPVTVVVFHPDGSEDTYRIQQDHTPEWQWHQTA